MGKKAGIFDPWRQEEEAAPVVQERDGWDESQETRHCVTFQGQNGGVNVWLPTDQLEDATAQKEARTRLAKALVKLEPTIKKMALSGISYTKERVDSRGSVSFTDGTSWVRIRTDIEDEDMSEYAVSHIVQALRFCQKREPVYTRQVLDELGIKPFIK